MFLPNFREKENWEKEFEIIKNEIIKNEIIKNEIIKYENTILKYICSFDILYSISLLFIILCLIILNLNQI